MPRTLLRYLPSTTIPPVGTFFFSTATPPTEIYTLSLHDALPICEGDPKRGPVARSAHAWCARGAGSSRSEEHTSELQSRGHLVCRLLLEKKKIYLIGEIVGVYRQRATATRSRRERLSRRSSHRQR